MHEINAPIDALKGYEALLKQTGLNKEQKHYLGAIDEQIAYLQQIISHMKSFEKNPGQYKLTTTKAQNVDLLEEIEKIVESFSNEVSHKDIELSLFTEPDLPRKVMLEKEYLYEVMSNLMHHVLHRTEPYKPVDLSIFVVEKKDEEHYLVRFEIAFGGKPYSPEEIDNIERVMSKKEIENDPRHYNPEFAQCFFISEMLRRMGATLHVENHEGDGAALYFDLMLKATRKGDVEGSKLFDGLRVGVALPSERLRRKKVENLSKYVAHFGADLTVYAYDKLFGGTLSQKPQLLFVYHHYARLEGELEALKNTGIPIVLITTPILRSRLEIDRDEFEDIVYEPLSFLKMLRIVRAYERKHAAEPVHGEAATQEEDDSVLRDMTILIAEDNRISAKILKARFGRFGSRILVAENAKAIERILKEHRVQMLLVDKDMLVDQEFSEAINRIRFKERAEKLPHLPMVVIANTPSEEETYKKMGFDTIIEKSADDARIKSLLQTYSIDYDLEHFALKEDENDEDELGSLKKLLSGNDNLLL